MTNPHTRISVRKKRAIKYGRKITRVLVGATRKVFTVHEDLLCSRSLYFRKTLQEKRKPIEDECPICHEDLDPGIKELTFCSSSCGVNLHYECMQDWENQSRRAGRYGRQRVTCPMCRVAWVNHKTDRELRCPELEAEGFEVFSEWLYTVSISTGEPDELDFGVLYTALVKAYALGVKIDNLDFRNASLGAIAESCSDTDEFPGAGAIFEAYRSTTKQSGFRRFLVDLYVTSSEAEWFTKDDTWKEYPQEFLKDLLVALLKKRGDAPGYVLVEMKESYFEEEEELEEARSAQMHAPPSDRSSSPDLELSHDDDIDPFS